MRTMIRLVTLGTAATVVAACVLVAASRSNAAAPQPVSSPPTATLPRLGTQLTPLPDGAGKAAAEAACLSCHSSDLIRQQRLTKAQWTGTLTKMVNWGTVIPEDQRDVLLEYLAKNFGPDNASFQPVLTRPVGR